MCEMSQWMHKNVTEPCIILGRFCPWWSLSSQWHPGPRQQPWWLVRWKEQSRHQWSRGTVSSKCSPISLDRCGIDQTTQPAHWWPLATPRCNQGVGRWGHVVLFPCIHKRGRYWRLPSPRVSSFCSHCKKLLMCLVAQSWKSSGYPLRASPLATQPTWSKSVDSSFGGRPGFSLARWLWRDRLNMWWRIASAGSDVILVSTTQHCHPSWDVMAGHGGRLGRWMRL